MNNIAAYIPLTFQIPSSPNELKNHKSTVQLSVGGERPTTLIPHPFTPKITFLSKIAYTLPKKKTVALATPTRKPTFGDFR